MEEYLAFTPIIRASRFPLDFPIILKPVKALIGSRNWGTKQRRQKLHGKILSISEQQPSPLSNPSWEKNDIDTLQASGIPLFDFPG